MSSNTKVVGYSFATTLAGMFGFSSFVGGPTKDIQSEIEAIRGQIQDTYNKGLLSLVKTETKVIDQLLPLINIGNEYDQLYTDYKTKIEQSNIDLLQIQTITLTVSFLSLLLYILTFTKADPGLKS